MPNPLSLSSLQFRIGPQFRNGLLGLMLWAGALWSATRIRHLGRLFGEPAVSLCDPTWGCAPPWIDLLAWHTTVLVGLILPWVVLRHCLPTAWRARVFFLMFGLSLVGLIGYALFDTGSWCLALEPPATITAELVGRRLLFSIVTLTDVPAMQTALLSLAFYTIERWRMRAASNSLSEKVNAQPPEAALAPSVSAEAAQ